MSLLSLILVLQTLVLVGLTKSWVVLINLDAAARSSLGPSRFVIPLLVAVAAVVLLLPVAIGSFIYVKNTSRRLSGTLASLCSYANDRIRSEMVLPFGDIEPKAFFFLCWMPTALFILWLLFAAKFSFLGTGFLLLLSVELIPRAMNLKWARTPSWGWKHVLVRTAYLWSFVCAMCLICVSMPGLPVALQGDPRLPILTPTLQRVLSFYASHDSAHLSANSILGTQRFLIAVLTFLPLTLLYLSFWRCSLALREWRHCFPLPGIPGAGQLPQTAENSRRRRFELFVICCHYVLCSFLTLTASLVSIDGFVFLVTGRGAFLQGLWSSTLVSFGILFAPPASIILCSLYIALMCTPLVSGVLLNAKRLVSLFLWPLRIHFANRRRSLGHDREKVALILDALASSAAFERPRVMILDSMDVKAFTRFQLFGRRPTLFLSRGALRFYGEDELTAVVAHEIGHSTGALRTVEWIRLISALTFFSNYYLMLCLDYSREESTADEFAVKATKDANALISAIVKTAAIAPFRGSEKTRKPTKRGHLLSEFLLLVDFIFGEGLLGYFHPPLPQRIPFITQLGGNYGRTD